MDELNKLQRAVVLEYDSRHLASRTRYSALNRVIEFIRDHFQGNVSCLELDKGKFIQLFVEKTGYTGQASKSAINELYNQYRIINKDTCYTKTPSIQVKKAVKEPGNTALNGMLHSFPPVVDSASEILVLGTMPAATSISTTPTTS